MYKSKCVQKTVSQSIIHLGNTIPNSLSIKGTSQNQHTIPKWTLSLLTTISEQSGLETNCKIPVHVAYTISKMAYKWYTKCNLHILFSREPLICSSE